MEHPLRLPAMACGCSMRAQASPLRGWLSRSSFRRPGTPARCTGQNQCRGASQRGRHDGRTRIEEIGGRDRGFLWRLNSYWHYEQEADGVRVEAQSLSLSRPVPVLRKPADAMRKFLMDIGLQTQCGPS